MNRRNTTVLAALGRRLAHLRDAQIRPAGPTALPDWRLQSACPALVRVDAMPPDAANDDLDLAPTA